VGGARRFVSSRMRVEPLPRSGCRAGLCKVTDNGRFADGWSSRRFGSCMLNCAVIVAPVYVQSEVGTIGSQTDLAGRDADALGRQSPLPHVDPLD